MTETTDVIAYDQAKTAIALQAAGLDELRGRTGILLAAASIVTSFLASTTLDRDHGFDALIGGGLIVFLAVIALTLAILWPRDWSFALGAEILVADWRTPERINDVAGMREFVAKTPAENWDTNYTKLKHMHKLFTWAIVALAVDVVLWTVKLATVTGGG